MYLRMLGTSVDSLAGGTKAAAKYILLAVSLTNWIWNYT